MVWPQASRHPISFATALAQQCPGYYFCHAWLSLIFVNAAFNLEKMLPISRKTAIVNIGIFLLGAILLASVWQTKGRIAEIVGLAGILVMLMQIFRMKAWLENLKVQTASADEFITGGTSETKYVYDDTPKQRYENEQNPALKRKLVRWFGGGLVLSLAVVTWGYYFKETGMFVGFSAGLWCVLMLAMLHQTHTMDDPARDFAYTWGKYPVFRMMHLLMGVLASIVPAIIVLLAPPPPNQGPYVIGVFGSLVLFLGAAVFYSNYFLRKDIPELWEGWTPSEKRLEQMIIVASVVLFVAGFPILNSTTHRLLFELKFCLLFAGAGWVLGYLAHDYLKNRFTGFFKNEERYYQLLACVYLSGIILTLCAATVFNQITAANHTETRVYRSTDKSKTYKGKHYLWLEIDGKNKRFEPPVQAWEHIQPGDSVRVLVGRGALGFECALAFD